jgi:hypothetical protein
MLAIGVHWWGEISSERDRGVNGSGYSPTPSTLTPSMQGG